MSSARRGFELPLRLLLGFRTLIDRLHTELSRQGHPDVRPVHGFVLQAVGPDGSTTVDVGRRLGMSKQAAAKHVERLERLGYLSRTPDPADARRKTLRLTGAGHDVLARSALILDELRREWVATLGEERLAALEDDLRTVTPGGPWSLDVPGWLGGG
jgi:DNA-binding MarR family transcriptional regulator